MRVLSLFFLATTTCFAFIPQAGDRKLNSFRHHPPESLAGLQRRSPLWFNDKADRNHERAEVIRKQNAAREFPRPAHTYYRQGKPSRWHRYQTFNDREPINVRERPPVAWGPARQRLQRMSGYFKHCVYPRIPKNSQWMDVGDRRWNCIVEFDRQGRVTRADHHRRPSHSSMI